MRLKRAVVEIEILGDADITDMDNIDEWTLGDISYQITEGSCSGVRNVKVVEDVEPEKMAVLLTAQGSDPSFLLGDEEDGG